jgi:hypothetical protein
MPSFEVLLPLGAIGFYLLDATALLYGNELVLEWRRGAWRSSTGFEMQVGGRRPFVPNAFAPHGLLFRVRWDVRARREGTTLDVANLAARLAPIRVLVTVQAVMLLLVLPALSIGYGAGLPLLLLFAAYYVLTLASLGLMCVRRRALGLSPRQCAGIALEAVFCAPFAINLARKVSLARSADVSWLELGRNEFQDAARLRLRQQVAARIGDALVLEETGSVACARLEALRESIEEQLDGRVVA